MTCWHMGRTDSFEYRKVALSNLDNEIGTVPNITGGEVELSALSDLKATGSLTFTGNEKPDDRDLVRIYYTFIDALSSVYSAPLATMRMTAEKPTYDGAVWSGSIALESLLGFLARKKLGLPYTVPAGTNAIAKAAEIVRSFGLKVEVSSASSYVLSSDLTLESSDSYLTLVNRLLSMAGFNSAWTDAWGTVQFTHYVAPTERACVWIFDSGANSIMYPAIQEQRGRADCNACRMDFSTDEETLYAYAINVDPDSPSSVVSKGYEETLQATATELSGSTQAARLESLIKLTEQRLIDNSSEIEKVEFKTSWVPIIPNDAIQINYESAGMHWGGCITNMRIRFENTIPCSISARRFITRDLLIEKGGGVL